MTLKRKHSESEPRDVNRNYYYTAAYALIVAAVVMLSPASPASASSSKYAAVISLNGKLWAFRLSTPRIGYRLLNTDATDRSPAFATETGMLAFHRIANGRPPVVYVAEPNGTVRPLIEGRDPAFSPLGKRIVISTSSGLVVTDVATGLHTQQLTNNGSDAKPSWGLGTGIVFERQIGTKRIIFALKPNDSQPVPVVKTRLSVVSPRFPPRGKALMISVDPANARRCTRARLGKQVPVQSRYAIFLFAAASRCNPSGAWSPSGHRVVLPIGRDMVLINPRRHTLEEIICGAGSAEGAVLAPWPAGRWLVRGAPHGFPCPRNARRPVLPTTGELVRPDEDPDEYKKHTRYCVPNGCWWQGSLSDS